MKIISFYCFVITLLLNHVYAKEDFMLVFVPKEKVNSVHDAIQEIIMENKDSYEDKENFEQIQIDFDNDKDKFAMDYGDSGYVFPISTSLEPAVLSAYLTPELVKQVEALSDVISVEENAELKAIDEEVSISAIDETEEDDIDNEIANISNNINSVSNPNKTRNANAGNASTSSASTNFILKISNVLFIIFAIYLFF